MCLAALAVGGYATLVYLFLADTGGARPADAVIGLYVAGLVCGVLSLLCTAATLVAALVGIRRAT